MKSTAKVRLDQLLVDSGLAESRQKAQALLLAGQVLVNGQPGGKPGRFVAADTRVELTSRLPYVSRGGIKLEAALRTFSIEVRGKVCLDIGASTGGFTDCLLQHGAARVHAVDTGAGQIDWRLRTDPRVVLHENTNARYLEPPMIGEAADLIVCDVSFISATLVLVRFPALLKPEGGFVVLVKPQFEAGREHVSKGGIVRDPEARDAACQKVRAAAEALGFRTSLIPSPITGAEGNQEYLLYAHH